MTARPVCACGREIAYSLQRRRTPRSCVECRGRPAAPRRLATFTDRARPSGVDYTVLAERELGLDFHGAGADGRRLIIDRAEQLLAAARAAGTYRDPHVADHAANVRRDAKRRNRPRLTQCRRGHALTPENVYACGGNRQCKQCSKDRDAARWARRSA